VGYAQEYARSLEAPRAFWSEQARALPWYKFPQTILDQDPNGAWRWFRGGKTNTCWLALDRHVEAGAGERIALVWDSAATGRQESFTYAALAERTARVAGGLRDLGVGRGDRVVIYMPMVPEAAVAMLACARIGAIHSVVFGGFAPPELASRIDDARPSVILSASCGIEFANVIPYKPLVDEINYFFLGVLNNTSSIIP
jgi:acyl-coenzyme A synthetase/AMP-(fatty) acid ligase